MALTDEEIIEAPGIMSRWVRLASGAKAHYVTSGDTGLAVILCHGGLPGSSGIAGWRFQLPFLGAHGYRVYAPDFPSYGHADTDSEHWPVHGYHSHVEFLRMFMDALCIDEAHFSGNSMGSSICWRFAISHPERVKNFVLIAGNIPGIVPPEQVVRTMSLRGLNRETFDGTPASMRRMMEPIIEDKSAITDDLLEMRTRAATPPTRVARGLPRRRRPLRGGPGAPPALRGARAARPAGHPAHFAVGRERRAEPRVERLPPGRPNALDPVLLPGEVRPPRPDRPAGRIQPRIP